ncbi:propanoyl-CoA acyltransferase [Candidatus Methylospira mobilis]|uniref:Propanoyl-CoA acyltransferase n=1 Tax=Candidatus Methylospira mobilis TaxID=1808979 RepID=A0A5Q0BNB9_9GAMM|nr:propanoyl-CoA acyltransferase [Candidatus Methylospira mobilis]QFY43246.1 propanoyl-CoA acyltransferase [Candidatus Methylospira mobilis]
MSEISIIGAYNTEFGAFVVENETSGLMTDTKTYYDLLIEAGRGAIVDSGLEAKDIDAIYVGSSSPSLFVNQEHVAPIAAEIDPVLRFKPMTRCESACASSSVALYNAIYAVEAGRARRVLVIGVEKMNLLPTPQMTHVLACCSHWPSEGSKGWSFPMLFAAYAKAYQAHYMIPPEEFEKMLYTVAALGYKNGAENPLAHMKDGPSSVEAIMKLNEPDARGKRHNMMIAEPLRMHDCSLVSDGAAALVITRTAHVSNKHRAVEIAGIGHSVERLPENVRPNMHELMAGKDAAAKAYKEANITSDDIDLAEVHDCFTINQILSTEALGLSTDGRGGYDYLDGRFTRDDKVAVNLSGGLKAKGHPVGATGASMHTLIYKQLIGEAIGVKAKKADIGVAFNVGGSAVTNCVTVLRKL